MKKLCLVLGAGGMRGRAHIGVIKRLHEEHIPIHSIIGCSAGALVAAYYAACGMTFEQLSEKVGKLRGSHLVAFSIALKKIRFLSRIALKFSGSIPQDLEELEKADFSRLFHGIEKLGVLVFDLKSMKALFLCTGSDNFGLTLAEAVRGSAATPFLFFPKKIVRGGGKFILTDGGLADPLPVKHAFSESIGADIALAVNVSNPFLSLLLTRRLQLKFRSKVIIIKPRASFFGTIFSSVKKTADLIRRGEESIDRSILMDLRQRLSEPFS